MTLTYRVHDGGWLLTSDWPFTIEEGRFVVPKGTLTDLASIPRFLWWLPGFACFELGSQGPVAHDWAYSHGGQVAPQIRLTRRRADLLFRRLMRADGVGRFRAGVAWAAVRGFGFLAWHRLRKRGPVRIAV